MSFFTPPLKQRTSTTHNNEKLSLTLSQGKKKRISKQLNLKDGEYGSDIEKNMKKSMATIDTIQDDSSGSSDSECEVLFESEKTILKQDEMKLVTNDFALDFQVSSVAIDRAGRFVVAGFNNGTIRLYPLKTSTPTTSIVVGSLESDETTTIDENKLIFRKGVVLEHISARGMYTQLRVNVVIPDDGRFIFAGVYRGSTEILVIDIDSILLPTDVIGVPTAEVTTHSYNDAKLRGFGAVRAMAGNSSITSEYQVLCGLGIKNLHLWRFFWDPSSDDPESKWTWQCIFDRQTNGISIEYLAFGSESNQLLSKSEHQTLRVWTIDETNDAMNFDYEDIKHTQDMVQVSGDYAYGGQQHLAVVNLKSGQRIELNLPASTAPSTRPTLNNRKRQLRTVSFLSGVEDVKLGVCSDGSVFVHDTAPENGLGVHNPPTSVTGYESFYQDQAGLLSILPYTGNNETDEWLVVMANSTQLQVKLLHEFLHLPKKEKEIIKPQKENKKKRVKDLPPLKQNGEVLVETTTKPKKEKKTWNYQVLTETKQVDEIKLNKRKTQETIVSSIYEGKESIKPTIQLVPVVAVNTPSTPKHIDDNYLYHTPQPKRLKTREKEQVLSPIVTISPASSPCPLETPKKPNSPVREWSPFVIPKKKKNLSQEIASQLEIQPEPETMDHIVQVDLVHPDPIVPIQIEIPSSPLKSSCQVIQEMDRNEMELKKIGSSLLHQVFTIEDDRMNDFSMKSIELLNEFEIEKEILLKSFEPSYKRLIQSICKEIKKLKNKRFDIKIIKKKYQIRLNELLNQQKMECDALYAIQYLKWSNLYHGPFQIKKIIPFYSISKLFH